MSTPKPVGSKSTVIAATSEKPGSSPMTLLGAATRMMDSLTIMHDINVKANFIALNAAIEAARSQSQTENFALVADQISRQAQRTEELASKLQFEIESLQQCALKATAVRYADIASDIIDKIDRNLFERNCDCQAWATFEAVVACAKATKDESKVDLRSVLSDLEKGADNAVERARTIMSCSDQLSRLQSTYMVYEDIFVINNRGVVVAAAKRQELIGEDQSKEEYFRFTKEQKKVFVTDMHKSRLVGSFAVSYSAPIISETGQYLGCVTTRFDWKFAQEIIDKMILDKDARVFIVNKDGSVLASTSKRGTLTDNMSWLASCEESIAGGSGYTIEGSRNGRSMAYGYCHTRGFGTYPGKSWSAIVCHPVELKNMEFLNVPIPRDGESHLRASEIANGELVLVAANIKEHVKAINFINNETNMLAVNASIQAGVAGAEGESFSVIASEIGKLAKQSEEFVSVVNSLTEVLGQCVQQTVAVRLGDAAFDTIDKIDRNLFERYCDVQAFATFKQFQECARSGKTNADALDLLKRAHGIYECYHDIFLLDAQGNIVGTAIRREYIGTNQSDREWFRECARGNVVVTDVYRSKSINDYTVTFAAPIKDEDGRIIGVVSTRFNCEYITGIMKAAIVGQDSKVFLINSKGLAIGTPNGEGILEKSFAAFKAFREINTNASGFVTETSPADNLNYTIGYARTPGYNSYKGKGWAVLITRLAETTAQPLTKLTPAEDESNQTKKAA